jgi:hypothetical protein
MLGSEQTRYMMLQEQSKRGGSEEREFIWEGEREEAVLKKQLLNYHYL